MTTKKDEDLPESKSFVDVETRTTADITLVDASDLKLKSVTGKVYWFNRLVSGKPSEGGGTKVLKEVLSFIDKVGVPLINQPSAYGKLTQKELTAFYLKHGFSPTIEHKNKLLIYKPKE